MNKLAEARKGKGMTQQGLADAAGIPLRVYQRYEYGKRQPVLGNAKSIADALGIQDYTGFCELWCLA